MTSHLRLLDDGIDRMVKAKADLGEISFKDPDFKPEGIYSIWDLRSKYGLEFKERV